LQIRQDLPGSSYHGLHVRYAENIPAAILGGASSLLALAMIAAFRRRMFPWWDYGLAAILGPTALLIILLAEGDFSGFFSRRN
jgi:hypothetical protein